MFVYPNALSPISSRLSGKVITERSIQSKNAVCPITFKVFGNETLVKLYIPSKALKPICSTPLGITILELPRIPLNDSSPIMVTFLPSIDAGMYKGLLSTIVHPVSGSYSSSFIYLVMVTVFPSAFISYS